MFRISDVSDSLMGTLYQRKHRTVQLRPEAPKTIHLSICAVAQTL